MANVRIKNLPADATPNKNDLVPLDNATTRAATIENIVKIGRPFASQAEAEAGVDFTTAMNPLTVKQAIAAQGAVAFATASQGSKADTAVQPDALAAFQPLNPVLSATTASFTTGDEAKLDGVEASADVTANALITAIGSTTERSLAARFADVRNIKDFGGGTDVADNAAAIDAAASLAGTIFVPEGDYPSSKANFNAFSKKIFGLGQIGTVAGKLPPIFSRTSQRPSVIASSSSLLTAFSGDLSQASPLMFGKAIVGADTLGTPATGYLYTKETAGIYGQIYNTSGYNHDIGWNGGRTGAIGVALTGTQAGQGDLMMLNTTLVCTTTKPGATHYLANPAVTMWGGGVSAGTDLCSLTLGELEVTDYGYDVRGSAFVYNFDRTNDTGALSQFWSGLRFNSKGTKYCNATLQVLGKWEVGLDTTIADIKNAAIAIKANQPIEFNAQTTPDSGGLHRYPDVFNGWDVKYSSGLAGLQFRGSGNTIMLLRAAASAVNFLDVQSQPSGVGVVLQSRSGTDANVGMLYRSQGTGPHFFYSHNETTARLQFAILAATNSVNYLTATGAASGVSPSLSAAGSDTDIDVRFTPKGAGHVRFSTWAASGDAAVNGYIIIKDAAGNIRKLATIA